MTANLSLPSEWLRANVAAPVAGVDRTNSVIRGYVVAQLGPFKTPGRGAFDEKSLAEIVRLGNAQPAGLKSRFAHPTLSEDGIGKFLGRSKSFRPDGDKVRADLHLDPTSFNTPSGNLGDYVMRLAESDPGALSSSLVVKADREYRLAKDGTRQKADNGDDLPPLWRPKELHASDIVETGDAVHSPFLTPLVAGLPDDIVRQATALLDAQFGDAARDVVAARCQEWLAKYLDWRFEADAEPLMPVALPARKRRQLLREKLLP